MEGRIIIPYRDTELLIRKRQEAIAMHGKLWRCEESDHPAANILMTQREAHKWLNKRMGWSRHDGDIATKSIQECEKVIELCREYLAKAAKGACAYRGDRRKWR